MYKHAIPYASIPAQCFYSAANKHVRSRHFQEVATSATSLFKGYGSVLVEWPNHTTHTLQEARSY